MTETPSHAELVAAIEQARPLHWRTREADDERRAHLDTLTELLDEHQTYDTNAWWEKDYPPITLCRVCHCESPCPTVATVTTALQNMGAL